VQYQQMLVQQQQQRQQEQQLQQLYWDDPPEEYPELSRSEKMASNRLEDKVLANDPLAASIRLKSHSSPSTTSTPSNNAASMAGSIPSGSTNQKAFAEFER